VALDVLAIDEAFLGKTELLVHRSPPGDAGGGFPLVLLDPVSTVPARDAATDAARDHGIVS
jgi:hypothetical protein